MDQNPSDTIISAQKYIQKPFLKTHVGLYTRMVTYSLSHC